MIDTTINEEGGLLPQPHIHTSTDNARASFFISYAFPTTVTHHSGLWVYPGRQPDAVIAGEIPHGEDDEIPAKAASTLTEIAWSGRRGWESLSLDGPPYERSVCGANS